MTGEANVPGCWVDGRSDADAAALFDLVSGSGLDTKRLEGVWESTDHAMRLRFDADVLEIARSCGGARVGARGPIVDEPAASRLTVRRRIEASRDDISIPCFIALGRGEPIPYALAAGELTVARSGWPTTFFKVRD